MKLFMMFAGIITVLSTMGHITYILGKYRDAKEDNFWVIAICLVIFPGSSLVSGIYIFCRAFGIEI